MTRGPQDVDETARAETVPDAPVDPPQTTRRLGRGARNGIIGLAVVTLVGGVAAVVQSRDTTPAVAVAQPADTTTSPPAPWLSGASGEGALDGDFGAWRGRPVEISGTWVDNNDAMVQLAQLQPGEEYGDWTLPLDIAVGAIGEGETWAEAADGAYDARWRQSLTALERLRDGTETTYIRFAHEMNGNWYDWSVTEDDAEDFMTAWKRYRALQERIFPDAQLVFNVNRESVDTGMDWRDFFPGAEYVDVLAVDIYNRNPYVDTAEDWQESLTETDDWGGPKGLSEHLAFARSVGLPFAVPEWSGAADEGDSPAFIEGMNAFFEENGGDGPGEVLYEIQFNIDKDEKNWVLYDPYTKMPESADVYQRLW